MAGIPLDIVEAARAVYAKLGRGSTADEAVIAQALAAERERCAEVARRQLEVSQQVAARSNLVGYAHEFYGAARHQVPGAIRQGGAS